MMAAFQKLWRFFTMVLFLFFAVATICYSEEGDIVQKEKALLIELNVRANSLEKRMEDLKWSIEGQLNQMKESFDHRLQEIDKRMALQTSQFDKQMDTFLQVLMALVAAFVGIVGVNIAIIVWDRRSMVKPFESKFKEAEEQILANKSQIRNLIRTLRKIAPSNPQLAQALKAFSLL